jgi:hypothetical protein
MNFITEACSWQVCTTLPPREKGETTMKGMRGASPTGSLMCAARCAGS